VTLPPHIVAIIRGLEFGEPSVRNGWTRRAARVSSAYGKLQKDWEDDLLAAGYRLATRGEEVRVIHFTQVKE
jgi:hypothetical protein